MSILRRSQRKYLIVILAITILCYSLKFIRINEDFRRSLHANKWIKKDNFRFITAITSNEFEWLLKFMDAMVAENDDDNAMLLTVCTLNLRTCELEYLMHQKEVNVEVYQFPYQYHPLHIRQYHIMAVKPIFLAKMVATYGEAVWIEPNTKLPFPFGSIAQIFKLEGFISLSTSKEISEEQCMSNVIGFTLFSFSSFLADWESCARNESCIAKAVEKSENHYSPPSSVDKLFEFQRKKTRLPCTILEVRSDFNNAVVSTVYENWKNKHRHFCQHHKGCVLTGKEYSYQLKIPSILLLFC